MTLTRGTGPFAKPPQASEHFNFVVNSPKHVLFSEESPRRVRVVFAGETIADTQAAKMLHETAHLPRYYFPKRDVRMELLHPTDHHTHCPFKGDASYWSVRVGDAEATHAVWSYPEPMERSPLPPDYLSFDWEAMDAWYEEDEPIFGHPRDPYHRVDVRRSTRRVIVKVGGETVAETYRPLLLFETGLPTRYYIPRDDVRGEYLVHSVRQTLCPYKGRASYWSVRINSSIVQDVVWCYQEPLAEALKVAGCLCFYQEHQDVCFEVS